ncbi:MULTISPECIES: nitroreductase family protein [Agrobacterium]|uniref:nitroreductase family protein n=1 Tax=Agrobacterium TaxID=357 RepID=UPI00307F60A6
MKQERACPNRNLKFLGAPVGLTLTIDGDLLIGSWLDYGMFLQNIMLAARAKGLETCPPASLRSLPQNYPQLPWASRY